MTRDPEKSERWREYYARTGQRPPRETLVFALGRFADEPVDAPRLAVDLGCGSGRDTAILLAEGWSVLAVDAEPSAIEALRARDDIAADVALETRIARFEDVELPRADLINSSFALPLCAPEAFPRVWAGIVAALKPGGRFSGQFYGPKDDWHGDPTITHVTRDEALAILAPLEVEHFREEEDDTVTPRGKAKHWHIFHIVARRP